MARAKLTVNSGTVPSKHRAGKENTVKTSTFMNIIAALAIGVAFPLGTFAAEPTKATTQQGAVHKKAEKAEKVKAPRKHYFAHGWLES